MRTKPASPCGRRLDVLWPLSVNRKDRHVNRERLGASRRRERHERPWQRLDGVKEPGAPALPHTAACVPTVPQIAACVPTQIKVKLEQTTRGAVWSAAEDRRLLVQRWQGAKVADLTLPNKTPKACALRWNRFHAKVLDTTMANLPEHASSDFVAELSDLMSDHAWWVAVEEKQVELLNDRAGALLPSNALYGQLPTPFQLQTLSGRDRPVPADADRAPTAEGAHATPYSPVPFSVRRLSTH